MDVTTCKNRRVIALQNSRYLVAKVDQDSRPDLSNRYEDFGWPATVVFDGEGNEIVKRRGYRDPEEMASMLQAIIDDPSAEPSVKPEPKIAFPRSPLLSEELRNQIRKDYLSDMTPSEGAGDLIKSILIGIL